MLWSRAVWLEKEQDEEFTIPSHWVQDGHVRWPKVTNASRYLEQRVEPSELWWSFPLPYFF